MLYPTNQVKFALCLIGFLILGGPIIYAQNKALQSELSEKFEDYKVVSFDFDQFLAKKNSNKASDIFTIKIDKWDIDLYQHDLVSSDYRLRVAYPDGIREEKVETNITYRGSVRKTGEEVVLTITEDFVFGTIVDGSKTFFIEPVSSYTKDQASNKHVIYDVATINFESDHKCGVEDVIKQKDKIEQSPSKSMMGCVEVDLGVASDYLYYLQHNSTVRGVVAKTLAVMNLVDTDYDDPFNDEIRFKITDQFISTCNSCDPWTASTNASNLLASFRTWGNGSTGFPTSTDLGQLWSGRDFDGSTIGLAYLGVVCGSSNYHILENYAPLGWNLRVLTSHEIGHNFDCNHDGGGGFIMSPSVNNTTTWSTTTINAVNAHVNSISCLGSCSIHLTSQNSATTWTANGSNTASITWDINGSSNLTGCSNVDILFSIDGGGTFPFTLASNTSNDGSHTVTIPDYPSTEEGRVKIMCTNNVNNDINNTNIELISDCVASPNFFINNSGLNYMTGQTIDLDIDHYISQSSYNATSFPSSSAIGYNQSTTSTNCATLSSADYDTYTFTVSASGTYIFQQAPAFIGYTLYDGTYNSSNPCNGYIASSLSASGSSISVSSVNLSGTFTAGNTYEMLITDYFGTNETVSFLGAGFVGTSTLPTNYQYTYVAVDQSNDQVDMVSNGAVFTGLGAGTYDIYGVMYENDGSNSVAPADVDPASFVGQTLSAIIATGDCLYFSDNSEVLTITGTSMTWYADTDGDSFGDNNNSTTASSAPAGFVADNTDCDDTNANVNPGATEICNGIDDDCDGMTDEGVQNTYYADTDSDGFGDPGNTSMACTAPAGFITDNTDCDDTDNTVYPGAPELCDGQDNNCDGILPTDEIDNDSDGYVECTFDPAVWEGSSNVVGGDDCDDNDINNYPGNTEVCDGQDNNCDGVIDEGVQNTYYADTDSDGFGDPGNSTMACTAPAGFITDNTDCDDTDNTIYPGAPELCDGQDNNCDGTLPTDEIDNDSDGYVECSFNPAVWQGSSNVVGGDDCNDTDANINPGAAEICGDSMDNDCDGLTDEGCGPAPDCDGAYLVINVITQDTYRAFVNIESTATVNSTDDILFTAGSSIDLLPGFEVVVGTQFEARIEPCSNFAPGPVVSNTGVTSVNNELLESFAADSDINVTIINIDNVTQAGGVMKTSEVANFLSKNMYKLSKGTYKLIVNDTNKEVIQDILVIK